MRIRLGADCRLNLEATLCCGQAFRWEKQGEWWYGVTRQGPLKIRQHDDWLEFENASVSHVKEYFGLEDDLHKIYEHIRKDKLMRKAIERSKGLRILRQDPWECLVSYVCATYKNIPAIRSMFLKLCAKFGDKASLEGQVFYTFPSAKKLAEASLGELKECGVGYRAEYVSETAKIVLDDDVNLELLRTLPLEEARRELLRFPGVGPKVADCVLLFSFERLDAFPVDVWMRRTILRNYATHFPREFVAKMTHERSLTKAEYERLGHFGKSYFGKYAGYAQEYLYHYERVQG